MNLRVNLEFGAFLNSFFSFSVEFKAADAEGIWEWVKSVGE